MKIQKLLILVLVLFNLFQLSAQIEGGVCYYANAGCSDPWIVVAFNGDKKAAWIKKQGTEQIKSNLATNPDFYYKSWQIDSSPTTWWSVSKCVQYDYCRDKSTTNRVVYRCKLYKYGPQPFPPCDIYGNWRPRDILPNVWCYIAFSKDKSSFIVWNEPLNNYDGKITGKTEFVRIPDADLLPKSVNYDFLED